MAYATYTTEAIVCGSFVSNTSDRSFLLFTKDAGMLYATARSVREERSKQRSALQEFSIIRVSLVKGKSGWRIGSVESEGNAFLSAKERHTRMAITSVIKALRRFVHGETVVVGVYLDTITIITQLPGLTPEASIQAVDRYMLRLLYNLGYIEVVPAYAELLTQTDWYRELAPLPAEATRAVTQALEASHL